MYRLATIVNDIKLYNGNLLKVDLRCSYNTHTRQKQMNKHHDDERQDLVNIPTSSQADRTRIRTVCPDLIAHLDISSFSRSMEDGKNLYQ